MKNVLRVATVDPNEDSRNALKTLLLGIDTVWLEAECSRYEFFIDVVQQTHPDIALVNVDSDPNAAVKLIGEITAGVSNCDVLVVSNSQEGSLILQVMRNGACEYLNQPLQLDDFIAALDRIRGARGTASGESGMESGKIITVAGVGGGIGSTAIAVNVAASLAQSPANSPVVIDLDLTLGDVDVWLDIIPDYTLRDVSENIGRLDYALLKRSLTRHECGVFLLPRPVELESQDLIQPDHFRRILALLKATFSHLIIDVSKSFGPLDLAAMDVSDEIFLVTQLDLSCLRNVGRIMQRLNQYNDLDSKVGIIVNRMGLEDSDISINKALEAIGREILWQLPDDYATMISSRNNGKPLCQHAPKARLTRSMKELTAQLSLDEESRDETEVIERKKGLFGLFSK